MAAACGVAADVPKKLGKPFKSLPPKNVVLSPSVAVMSGLARICGELSGLPAGSKRIVAGPSESKDSIVRWSRNGVASTAIASADAACGTIVGLLVAKLNVTGPNSLEP